MSEPKDDLDLLRSVSYAWKKSVRWDRDEPSRRMEAIIRDARLAHFQRTLGLALTPEETPVDTPP